VKSYLVFLPIFILLLSVIPSAYSVVPPKTTLQLYQESDVIVLGNVVSAEPFVNSDGLDQTKYTIQILQPIKSNLQKNTIDVIGLGSTNATRHLSDTYLIYNKDSEIQVTDPNGLFSDVSFSISDDGNIVFITVDLTFAKPMDSSDVIIRMWDKKEQSLDTIIKDMIVIVGDAVESTNSESPDTTSESQDTAGESEDGTITETTVNVPEWLKKNAGWWSQGQLDDSTFTNSVQYLIQNQIIDIPMLLNVSEDPDEKDKFAEEVEIVPVPEWIKNNAGWWSEGQIDDHTFLLGIEYLVENGIIIV